MRRERLDRIGRVYEEGRGEIWIGRRRDERDGGIGGLFGQRSKSIGCVFVRKLERKRLAWMSVRRLLLLVLFLFSIFDF